MPSPLLRPFIHFTFGAYAGALFLATHWPNVVIHSRVHRPDIYIHMTVFGAWNALLIASALHGPALSRRNIVYSTLIALVYAAVDEGLQAIPFVHRTAGLDDYAANAAGIVLVALAAGLIGWKRRA